MNGHSENVAVAPAVDRLPAGLGDGARGRVLDAALRLFSTVGFHGASMRELAKLAGLPASAVYLHFASKEHVLAELVRIGHEVHHAAIRGALLDAGHAPAAQLRALVSAHVRQHAQFPALAIVVHREMDALSPELAAPGKALRAQSAALLVDVLVRGTELGAFSPPDLRVAAAAIGAMGLRIPHWYVPSDRLPLAALVAHCEEVALRIVGAARE